MLRASFCSSGSQTGVAGAKHALMTHLAIQTHVLAPTLRGPLKVDAVPMESMTAAGAAKEAAMSSATCLLREYEAGYQLCHMKVVNKDFDLVVGPSGLPKGFLVQHWKVLEVWRTMNLQVIQLGHDVACNAAAMTQSVMTAVLS